MIEIFKKLRLNPINPRTISKEEFERLVKKIREFPQMLEKRPVVYDSSDDYLILGGNRRFDALKVLVKEGFELKDSYFSDAFDWTPEQKKQFVITDNISDGQWDYDMLANSWDDVPLKEWGVDGIKLDLGKIDDIEVDENRLFVLTVEAPEAIKLKERMAFYCENFEQYERVKKFFVSSGSTLDLHKLLKLIKEL